MFRYKIVNVTLLVFIYFFFCILKLEIGEIGTIINKFINVLQWNVLKAFYSILLQQCAKWYEEKGWTFEFKFGIKFLTEIFRKCCGNIFHVVFIYNILETCHILPDLFLFLCPREGFTRLVTFKKKTCLN